MRGDISTGNSFQDQEAKRYVIRMRLSPRNAANLGAWAAIFALIACAVVTTTLLGFVGLFIIGAATCLICVRADMDQDVPTWGTEVFQAQLDLKGSPEQRAAMQEERRAFNSPLRFYRRCGMFLGVVGLTGFILQHLAFDW